MITFRYPAMLSPLPQPRSHEKEIFANTFQDHHNWLEDNNITYAISTFIWPRMPIASHQVDVIEFEIIIENFVQAIMFRLYTGMTPSEVMPNNDEPSQFP